MKVFATIAKVLAAIAAIVGAAYVVATYGDKIVAWAKNLLGIECCDEVEVEAEAEETAGEEAPAAEAAEEAPAAEAAAAEEAPAAEAAAAEEAPAAEGDVVAEEGDFEG